MLRYKFLSKEEMAMASPVNSQLVDLKSWGINLNQMSLEVVLKQVLETPYHLDQKIACIPNFSPENFICKLFELYKEHSNARLILQLMVKKFSGDKRLLDLMQYQSNCFIWMLLEAEKTDLVNVFNWIDGWNTQNKNNWVCLHRILEELIVKQPSELTLQQKKEGVNRLFALLPLHCGTQIDTLINELYEDFSSEYFLLFIESIAGKDEGLTKQEELIILSILSIIKINNFDEDDSETETDTETEIEIDIEKVDDSSNFKIDHFFKLSVFAQIHFIQRMSSNDKIYLASLFKDQYKNLLLWIENLFLIFTDPKIRAEYFNLFTQYITPFEIPQFMRAYESYMMMSFAIECLEIDKVSLGEYFESIPSVHLINGFVHFPDKIKEIFASKLIDFPSKMKKQCELVILDLLKSTHHTDQFTLKTLPNEWRQKLQPFLNFIAPSLNENLLENLPLVLELSLISILENIQEEKNHIPHLLNLTKQDLAELLKDLAEGNDHFEDLANFFREIPANYLVNFKVFSCFSYFFCLPYFLTLEDDLLDSFCYYEIQFFKDEMDGQGDEDVRKEVELKTKFFHFLPYSPDSSFLLEKIKDEQDLRCRLNNICISHAKSEKGYACLGEIVTYLENFTSDEQFRDNSEFFTFMDQVPSLLIGVATISKPAVFIKFLPHLKEEQVPFIIKALPNNWVESKIVSSAVFSNLQDSKIIAVFKTFSHSQLTVYLNQKIEEIGQIQKEHQEIKQNLNELIKLIQLNPNYSYDQNQVQTLISKLAVFERKIGIEKRLLKQLEVHQKISVHFKEHYLYLTNLIELVEKNPGKWEGKSFAIVFNEWQTEVGKQEVEEDLIEVKWFWEFLTFETLAELGLHSGEDLLKIGITTIDDLQILGITPEHKMNKKYVVEILKTYCKQKHLKELWEELHKQNYSNLKVLTQSLRLENQKVFNLHHVLSRN